MSTEQISQKLEGISGRIKSLHSEYRQLISRGAAIAKEIGDLLIEARKLVTPRHHWSKWLATTVDMVPGTAYRYITIAAQWERVVNHAMFPDLNVVQMHDVARGKEPKKRKYSMRDQSLDVLLDILDERIVERVGDIPELEKLLDLIDELRPTLEEHGLLNSQVESRKQAVRKTRKLAVAAGRIE